MKLLTGVCFCILLILAGCSKEQAMYVDSKFRGYADGSSSAPFPTIHAALTETAKRNYISTHIFVKAGEYHEVNTIHFSEGAPFRHKVELIGDKGGKTIINDGGFLSAGSINFSLTNFTFINCSQRAIRQQGGVLHLNNIIVRDYRFSPNKSFATPSAIELINVCGTIDKLRFSACDQPNLRIVGPLASTDISHLKVSDSRYVMGDIDAEKNYLPTVEVRNGAKVLLSNVDLENSQGVALLIADGIAKLRYVSVRHTTEIAQGTSTIGTNILVQNSRVQAYRLYSTEAATVGFFLLNSTLLGEEVGITDNQFGLWYKMDSDELLGYRLKDCLLERPGVEIKKNWGFDLIPGGDFPVPDKPIFVPVPCPPACPDAKPPPANCYPVDDAVFYCDEE